MGWQVPSTQMKLVALRECVPPVAQFVAKPEQGLHSPKDGAAHGVPFGAVPSVGSQRGGSDAQSHRPRRHASSGVQVAPIVHVFASKESVSAEVASTAPSSFTALSGWLPLARGTRSSSTGELDAHPPHRPTNAPSRTQRR